MPLVTDETDENESEAPTVPPAPPAPAGTAQPAPPSEAHPAQHRPSGAINPGPVEYKGQPLDAERGPGLGCFRIQLVVLVVLIVVTPLSVGKVPDVVTAVLLFVTIALLLVSGQTIIFLLRLVAADRRGRRQPLAGRTPTVGQLEDAPSDTGEAAGAGEAAEVGEPAGADEPSEGPATPGSPSSGPVRQ